MKSRKISLAVAVGLVLATVSGTAAYAAYDVKYPAEGGKWEYGTSGTQVYSNYIHYSKFHGSSVNNEYGLVRSPDVQGNTWANARNRQANSGNQAFYRVNR